MSYNKQYESGFDNFDDCAIYKINEKQSIIQSVDFFTPIIDDPYTFGEIAASNSLSDIYAMGGEPLFALNIVAFPTEKLPLDILSEILRGGKEKCREANVNILGGHSIKDETPKYGLAVTGLIDNNKILKNNTANINDALILTKPLGTGIITTAIKNGLVTDKIINKVVDVMTTLNNKTSSIIQDFKIGGCTDVTGYGLIGHLNELCSASNLTAKINFKNINFIDKVEELAIKDVIPGGTKNNLKFYNDNIEFNNLKLHQQLMLSDAQTSGGLLVSVAKNDADKLINKLNAKTKFQSSIIGYLHKKEKKNIIINNE